MKVYLGIGGNLGNREKNLEIAIKALAQKAGTLMAVSPVYETGPLGFKSNDQFLNLVVVLETELTPVKILNCIMNIENGLGRKRRKGKYVSRTIDIDLLFYENIIIENSELIIPHPRMHERKFVLVPFCDIAPDYIHPVFQRSIRELLDSTEDKSIITKQK
jgi:2-amino-4-hydroxy-6-hydroxymethyldihydropteridine diphosphokinase